MVTMLHHQEDPRQTESGRNKAGSLEAQILLPGPGHGPLVPTICYMLTQSSSLLDKLPRVHWQEMPFVVLGLL